MSAISGLNDPTPTPSAEIKARTAQRAEVMRKAIAECQPNEPCLAPDPATQNNDSLVAPERTKREALRGFHGG